MERVKVRTVFRPDQETEMPSADAEMLRAQGLLTDDQAPDKGAETKAAAKPAPRKDAE